MEPRPGQKESRWFHKLAPAPKIEELQMEVKFMYLPPTSGLMNWIKYLLNSGPEGEVEALRYQVRDLTNDFRISEKNSNN